MAAEVFSAESVARLIAQASDDIKREVSALIPQASARAKSRIQAAYPIGPTGNLHRLVSEGAARYGSLGGGNVVIPARVVRATAPHVFIYQEGTRERYDATRKNAYRGRSPKHGRIFEAVAAQTRADMLAQAQAILDRPREI